MVCKSAERCELYCQEIQICQFVYKTFSILTFVVFSIVSDLWIFIFIGPLLIEGLDNEIDVSVIINIKCRVLETSLLTAREACNELSEKTGSEQIQVIGSKFVLYRENPKLPDEKRINLRK